MRNPRIIGGLLAFITLLLYWPLSGYQFVNYDDPAYIIENQHVATGLTVDNLKWAFTGSFMGNYDPLNRLSHLAVGHFFGLNPGAHHLASLLLHIANVSLLFFGLVRLTGKIGFSAIASALFAWHPVQVEAVAWVSERKGILSSFFWLLTIWAYLRFVEKRNWKNYTLLLLSFLLGLMSKPMLMTLPFALLLLDIWPLRRLQLMGTPSPTTLSLRAAVQEKIPLFILTAGWIFVAYLTQHGAGAVPSIEGLPLSERGSNAVLSYWRYLGNFVWPTQLAVFYPYPTGWPWWQVTAAVLGLIAVSLATLLTLRRSPHYFSSWFWYLGTLLPVIQIIQIGGHSMADRYFYIPGIGICVLTALGVDQLREKWPQQRIFILATTAVALVACLTLTRVQLSSWRNSETLFSRALTVTKGNDIAHYNLGMTLLEHNRWEEALPHFQAAVEIQPYSYSYWQLGAVLDHLGHPAEAVTAYREAIRLNPTLTSAYNNLGAALAALGKTDEAITNYYQAIKLNPKDAEAHFNLGTIFEQQGKNPEAIREYNQAVTLKPNYAKARNNLGLLLAAAGQTASAMDQYLLALKADPNLAQTHYNLGLTLMATGQLDPAASQFAETIRLSPTHANAHYRLAVIRLRQGKIEEAVALLSESLRLRPNAPAALTLLARLRATNKNEKIRNAPEALGLATKADELTQHQNAEVLDTLAAAYAANGRFPEAVAAAKTALRLAEGRQQGELAAQIQKRLQLFEQGLPWLESP